MNLMGQVHIRHMMAGISGGVVSTLLLHPLDLLKIRLGRLMQCHEYFHSFLDLLLMMEVKEGQSIHQSEAR